MITCPHLSLSAFQIMSATNALYNSAASVGVNMRSEPCLNLTGNWTLSQI